MDIKTKYSIGESVWFIEKRKVQNGRIINVDANIGYRQGTKVSTVVDYTIDYILDSARVNEADIYSTKEELIKSL